MSHRRSARPPVSFASAAIVACSLAMSSAADAASCWLPPVDAPVVDPFRPPPCRWCPGNRGIEYGTPVGTTVRAVATGTVTYAGSVAGVGYVVVRLLDGRRITYGNVDDIRVEAGDVIVRRMVLGVTSGRLHLGLRTGDRYLDPMPMIGRLVWRARLVPIDGRAPNPAPRPALRCGRRRAGPGVSGAPPG